MKFEASWCVLCQTLTCIVACCSVVSFLIHACNWAERDMGSRDVRLIDMLKLCPSPKPVLTTYPGARPALRAMPSQHRKECR